jgi:hypothetical protein
VVVGYSHMQQLSGAPSAIATQQHWQLTEIIRGACPFSTISEVVLDETDCQAWDEAALSEIADLRPDAVWTEILDLPSNVRFLDIADAVCDQTFCPAQVGNVLVYLDDNHLSVSYVRSMVPVLQDRSAPRGW